MLGDIETPLPPDDSDPEEPAPDASASFGQAPWQSVSKGSLDFLELFSGSARLSQSCALTGLKVVGSRVDLRTGFDLNTRAGKAKAMQIILEQKPSVIHMASKCTARCMWSAAKGAAQCEADRLKDLPMVRFCAQAAMHQIAHGRHFILENPKDSAM